jgi:hypothetical protein
MATKKLAEIIGTKIGNKNTELETWQKIRTELSDDIAAAFRLGFEHECCNVLGKKLGLSETWKREAIEKVIAGPIVASPDFLLLKLIELKAITSVPPQAFDFFNLVLNVFSHEFSTLATKILAAARIIAEAELKSVIATEEKFFDEFGLDRQETALSAGVGRVLEKLKSHLEPFGRQKAAHVRHLVPPAHRSMPEIFQDEIAKHEAAIAEIASEMNLSA